MWWVFVLPPLVLLVAAAPRPEVDISKQIAELEAEKRKLLQQISSAVLELSTDGTGLAVEVREELLDRLLAEDDDRSSAAALASETRRSGQMKKRDKDAHIFDINNLYSKKDRESKKWKNRMANKAKIQEKLDKWLHDRMLEKEKIKAYKEKERHKNLNKEKCPPFGWKKEKKWRRAYYDNRPRSGKKYPCCRKCCKKSYMHCL